jgi:histidinol phosphatase-like PHP family hydrolase/calcineurin-like phosphoesterase family protein
MKAKVVILTDLHFLKSANLAIPERKGEFADVLLLRAVHRLNRYIKPDLVFIGGDLINHPEGADGLELLTELKKIIDLIQAPTIVISGNHDLDKDVFENVMGKQPDFLDINGIRFVPFFDMEKPGYNAFRIDDELTRMRKLGSEFDGPLVSLQHVSLFPPESASCPYNYTNADEIIEIMHETNYVLTLSGHYHEGFELLDCEGLNYVTGRALCEVPFGYAIIEIDDKGKVSCEQENLAMPKELRLVDHHVHTKLAYCNENMDITKSIALGKMFGLDGIVISEHSAHLYFNKENYGQCLQYLEGMGSNKKDDRVAEYFALYAAEADDFCRLGMEVDYDQNGQGVIEPDVWDKIQFRNGSAHVLKSLTENPDMKAVDAEFLFLTEAIAASGVDVLVHPFRIFGRSGLGLPRHLFAPVVDILKRHGTAVEINYHTNEPPAEFFRMCIENGIKLSLGSDSHNLYEVGEFYANLKFLQKIAPDFDLRDLLIS